ncbi:TNF receptor-associated factor 3-like [Anneissia japonica]|uniref:TNF receptor-associated factor 3-like n=1 Tax=Anneissia japonica TaxID=1529436 RepID=UPI0014258FEE|nr:TNF receptor-associated factor 3-like [Anneissia japonica]
MAAHSLSSIQSSVVSEPPSSIGKKQGYDVTFKKRPIAEFFCGLCQFALRWPLQATCGCRFCKGCIHRYAERAESEQFLCPSCKEEEISINGMNPDHFARKKIDNMVIFCPNKSSGCGDEFMLKELKSHLEQCPFEVVECMHKERGCVAKMARRDYMNHLKIDCHFRVVTCDHCGEEITMQDRKAHKATCKMQPQECPNQCGKTNIPQNKMQDHLKNDCAKQSSLCNFSSYGCKFRGFPIDMKKHMAEDSDRHMEMVTKYTAQLELKYTESMRMVSEQQSKMNLMERKQEETEKELKTLKEKSLKNEKQLQNLQRMIASRLDVITDLEKKVAAASNKDDISEIRALLITEQDAVKDIRQKLQMMEDSRFVGVSVTGASGGIGAAQLNNFHSRITTLDKDVGLHSVRLAEQDLRFQILETASYDGVLIWKIKDFQRRKRDADSGKTLSLYSQPFYTSRFGYKMCARVYLNGDGMGKNSHVSLFFVVMKGDYDALLPWPFRQKVTLMLLDQETARRHLSDSFRPDPASSSFKRPATDMNIASGCPLFVAQSVLQDSIYVKDDTVFFKIIVDTSDLFV